MRIKKYKQIISIIFIMVLCLSLSVTVSAKADPRTVNIGGGVFGVRFRTDGVTVAGLEEIKLPSGNVCPARDAGLSEGDLITAVNGKKVTSSADVIDKIAASDGDAINVTYKRGGAERTVEITPVKDEKGNWRAGMWIRDSAAGIGTMTYYDSDTGEFGGLGHGICSSETGELIPLSDGVVTDVSISDIERGAAGAPGEIHGFFASGKLGELTKNTRTGVYGILRRDPSVTGEKIEVADKKDVKAGEVRIRCTLENGKTDEYCAVISDIDLDRGETKNFVITVTDERLIEKTGGIIQGMSGSPIVQNGKLIGAVTHVMINDPTKGYGIFIGNMLDAAE